MPRQVGEPDGERCNVKNMEQLNSSVTHAGAASTWAHESEVRSYCRRFGATFDRAAGSLVYDETGRAYIDFLAGCSALNYGHNPPAAIEAMVAYLTSGGIVHGLDLHTAAKGRFIDDFVASILRPRGLDYRLQFTGPTGTNAVEAALKLARKVTGRSEIIAFTNGFHGVSAGALAATGSRFHRMGPEVPLGGVQRALFDGYLGPDIDTAAILERMLDDPSSGIDPPAAIVLETVQGEGGLTAASAGWVQRIAEIARRHGALLIVDDIQAGCGRVGSFFSFEGFGIEPDLVVLSKSLSGAGLPFAMVLIRPEFDVWAPAEHNGTFRGNNLAFVSASAVLRTYWADGRLMDDVARRGELVRVALERMAGLVPGSRLKGRGLMRGLDVIDGGLADAVCRRAFADGLIIETSGPRDEVLKVLAPLTTPDDLLLAGLEVLERALAAEVERRAAGPVASDRR